MNAIKIFHEVQLKPTAMLDDSDYLACLVENLVVEAYRAGYYLPVKPDVRRQPWEDLEKAVIRAVGIKMQEADS